MDTLRDVELAMWTPEPGAKPPTVMDVRSALEANGFSEEHATDVPETTAFRRAVKAEESKDVKATLWKDRGRVHAQLDRLTPAGEVVKRDLVATYEAGDRYGLRVDSFAASYTWADVSKVIQTVLSKDGLGAFSPKRNGGVYFVPTSGSYILDRLQTACAQFGLRLLRYGIPDNSVQKDEIATAIHAAILWDLTQHAEAIGAYDIDTKVTVLTERRQRLQVVSDQIHRLEPHLNGRATELRTRVADLDQTIIALKTQQDNQPTRVGLTRRMVFA